MSRLPRRSSGCGSRKAERRLTSLSRVLARRSVVRSEGFGALALIANLACLRLLWRFRREEVNMVSTFECSRNDVISNVAMLTAAGAVALLRSPWPDILTGSAMALLFLRSSCRIIASAAPLLRAA